MNRLIRATVLIALLTAIVAGAGGWIGVQLGLRQAQNHAGLDEIVHRDLKLSSAQHAKLERLERDYAAKRRPLEMEMHAANADLADAIDSEHAYGPRAQEAVARFHRAMLTLQEETIRHVLAMRAIMDPDQARRFDGLVSRALKPPAT